MEKDLKSCKNCQASFVGAYCNRCGQKYIADRFTVKQVFRNAFTNVFKLDSGLWHTIRLLTTDPAKPIYDYINGKTKPYTAPFKYIIIASAVYLFVSVVTGTVETQVEAAIAFNKSLGISYDEIPIEEFVEFLSLILKNLLYINLAIIPFMSLASYWIMKKKNWYYAEHLIMNSYITAHQSILSLPILLLLYFIPSMSLSFMVVLFFLYFFYYIYVFKYLFDKSWMGAINWGSLVYTLGILLFFVLMLLVAYPIGYLAGMLSNI